MKSKSVLILLAGIAIGAFGGFLFTPEKKIKSKDVWKKSKKYKKAFEETASKYKKKLGDG